MYTNIVEIYMHLDNANNMVLMLYLRSDSRLQDSDHMYCLRCKFGQA